MSDEAYIKLREFLDKFPIGFPKTESGIEIKILKRLFTEEEARITVRLSPVPETAKQIARRGKLDVKEMEKKLELMSKKGLIFRVHRKGKTFYNAAPFMIGLYEYSVKKIDKELARLFKEYYDTAQVNEIGASGVPGFKVLPVDESIQANTVLYPYHKLKESIKNARGIAVTDCVCRLESQLNGEGCDYPIETCLSFGAAAEYYIENGWGREITPEEAIRIIEETDKAGLVHAGVNSKHLSNICNCCPCCCVSMKGITKMGHNKHKYLNAIFESIIDREKCSGCGSCIDRCPVGAIIIDDFAIVDRERCLGCGLCAGECPENAIVLQVREDGEEPFDRVVELGMAILKSKKKKPRT
ncbi:MAG: 4Fe-4S binding protein [Candidatus Helarchaeota archaeon]|nr:4Fe-4S binding protein [Candidatus Helarchaeota archaeon]